MKKYGATVTIKGGSMKKRLLLALCICVIADWCLKQQEKTPQQPSDQKNTELLKKP